MPNDVARFYLEHLHATAATPDLVLRALERALAELEAGDSERFARRLIRLRRSIQLQAQNRPLAALFIRALESAKTCARRGDTEGAKAALADLIGACARPRPRSLLA